MKIRLVGVTKRFGDQVLFDNLSFCFPEKGLVAIVGPSGCGKTTLLKMVAGLDLDYQGAISLDNLSMKGTPEETLERFRLENIGFVFQDFQLLNLDSVFANIVLPYLPFHDTKTSSLKRQVAEVLRMVGLNGFEKRIVNTLSGGEKQRVALARSLINDPSLLLCDEPTGALDQTNGLHILHILQTVSRRKLVLVVTHDEDMARVYADEILRWEEGNLTPEDIQTRRVETGSSLRAHYKISHHFRGIPLTWRVAHARANLKQKKWRTAISQMALGISLIGVGLSLSLSKTISVRIEKAMTSMLGEPSILMTRADTFASPYQSVYGAPLEELSDLVSAYPEYIDGLGVSYENNFEAMFQDANGLTIATRGPKSRLPSFSVRNINDFVWLSDVTESILPLRPPKMEDDELILGLSYDDLKTITSDLHINSTLAALASYLDQSEVFLSLELRNDDWGYEDEQIFSLIGVYLTETPHIVHANPFWNQWIFETCMRFPVTDDFQTPPSLPWMLRKVPYVHTLQEPSLLLDQSLKDPRFEPFVLERLMRVSHPSLCPSLGVCHTPRLEVFLVEKNTVEINDVDFVRKVTPALGPYVVCSPSGYMLYPSAFMAGFAKPTYFSASGALLEQVIDTVSVVSATEQNQTYSLPKGILSGSFLSTGNDAVRLHPLPERARFGRLPIKTEEIVLSERMAGQLYGSSQQAVGQTLFVGSMLSETQDSTMTLRRDFGTTQLTITGVVSGSTAFLCQKDTWGIAFFRDLLGVPSMDLLPTSVAFSLRDDVDESDLQRLHRQFPHYAFSDPTQVLSESIAQTTTYVGWVLFFLSGLGILISALLLSLVLYLFRVENQAENELLRTLGFAHAQRRQTAMMILWVLSGQTFFMSSVEMLILDVGLGRFLDDYFNVSVGLSVLPLPYLAMAGVTFVLTYVVGFLTTLKTKKRSS